MPFWKIPICRNGLHKFGKNGLGPILNLVAPPLPSTSRYVLQHTMYTFLLSPLIPVIIYDIFIHK